MEVVTPLKEGLEIIKEAGGGTLKLCFQCGLCTATCPWNMVKNFIIRRMIHETQFGLFEVEEWWQCTTCAACVKRCPRGVEIIDIMRALRRILVQSGVMPASLRSAFTSLALEGNPWRQERTGRADWAKDLDVKAFAKDAELLYFPCCAPAYDPRVRPVARATASILKKAGADFGILGSRENCCGESVRKAGDETLFQNLAKNNVAAFQENGVKKILVTSPHCYTTIKSDYPEFGGNFEVIHLSQYLAGLIREKRLKPTKGLNKKVAYHDPCYLGRHNGIYDEPREVLRSIPGLELVEMANSRENAICCGGGGGGIWLETKKGERLSDLRLQQAVDVKADILVTSCPYCILNFQDSVLTMHLSDAIQIKDISQLVDDAI